MRWQRFEQMGDHERLTERYLLEGFRRSTRVINVPESDSDSIEEGEGQPAQEEP